MFTIDAAKIRFFQEVAKKNPADNHLPAGSKTNFY